MRQMSDARDNGGRRPLTQIPGRRLLGEIRNCGNVHAYESSEHRGTT